jgi:hypothetical protein
MAKMLEILAKSLVYALTSYGGVGIVFAFFFVWRGIHRIDSEAQGSGIAFRLLILPGVAAFWPLFASRLARGIGEPPVENNSQRSSAS